MEITQYTTDLEQFRYELYQNLNKRADTLLELVDAMSSAPCAQSVVEYSLSECFRRSYSTIFRAIDEMAVTPMLLPDLLAPYLPKPRQRPYWLLMVDVTSQPRRYAQTCGKRQPKPLPMHEHPFTLVRIVRYNEAGQLACKRPLWLIVMGKRRHELNLAQIYAAYRGRFDIEHSGALRARFGKQKLLMTAFQTPEVDREENWWQLTHIAYAQLWLARHVAHATPRPWERNLPAIKHRQISPTLVQRDFARIIRQLGTPALPPKPRGISPGRRPGTQLTPRPRQNVVLKRSIAPSTA